MADRKTDGTWSGEVYINGHPRSHLFKRESAYVRQDDVHISTLTVAETLMYAAWTRLNEGISLETRQTRVNELLDIMGLSHIRNSLVGDAMTKGISGGQLKRLSIAVEIISLPKLIFLDEPTTGLDSSTAFEVMSAVRSFIDKEKIAISTIHQPSRAVFKLFDKLAILSFGRLIYFGNASEAINYFTQPQLGYKFENGFKNPVEFVIQISCGQKFPEGMSTARHVEDLEIIYKHSSYYQPIKINKKASSDLSLEVKENKLLIKINSNYIYATTTYTQICMVVHRTWLAKIRNSNEMIAQLGKNLLIGLIFGAVWFNKGHLEEPLYENGRQTTDVVALNSFFFIIFYYGIYGNSYAIPYLCANTSIYRRELASNAYGPFAFWFAMVFTLIPIFILFNLVFVAIIYPIVSLPSNAEYFFYFFFIELLACFAGYMTCLALAALVSTEDKALKLFPLIFLLNSVFTGYVVKTNDLPNVYKWIPYISYMHYAFKGIMVNEYTRFDTDDYNDMAEDGNGDVLADYNFENFNKENAIWILLLFIGMLSAIVYYGILPPKSKLNKVQNAGDLVTVLSRESSTFEYIDPTSLFRESSIVEYIEKTPESNYNDYIQNEIDTTTSISSNRSTGNFDTAQGCKVVFRDLSYKVLRKTDKIQITLLDGIFGIINPGEMCALMGNSGAGKSTLLDILAKRKNSGIITGEITYNGSQELKSFAYVMQDDIHIGILTIRESITYAAELRLKETMSKKKKARRVQKIIDILGLTKVSESVLGSSAVRGISGGQLKRVSIGVEIVHLPNLMFLDEPTTGLDSSISFEVISTVKNLANQNRTVICTIHQPSEDTFALFNTLLLLSNGKTIYFGNVNDAISYFISSPYKFNYEEGINPADFIIAVAGSFQPTNDGHIITGSELSSYFATTMQYSKTIEATLMIDNHQSIKVKNENLKDDDNNDKDQSVKYYNTSIIHQLKVLLHRRCLVMRKEWKLLLIQFIRNIILGLLYGTVFYNLCTDGSEQNCYSYRMSLFFFVLINQFTIHLDSVGALLLDRLVFYRERGAKLYGPFAYFISTTIPVLIFQIPNALIYSILIYYLPDLRSGYFGSFFIIILFTNFICMFLCYSIAAISSSTQVALTMVPIIVSLNAIYAGYVVFIPNLPGIEGTWLPYIVYFRYAFQGLILNEFDGNDDLYLSDTYIDELGFNNLSCNDCIGILLIFLIFISGCFYIALYWIDFEQR